MAEHTEIDVMHPDHRKQLLTETESAILAGQQVGLLGLTEVALELLRNLSSSGLVAAIEGIYTSKPPSFLRRLLNSRHLYERSRISLSDVLTRLLFAPILRRRT